MNRVNKHLVESILRLFSVENRSLRLDRFRFKGYPECRVFYSIGSIDKVRLFPAGEQVILKQSPLMRLQHRPGTRIDSEFAIDAPDIGLHRR